ncbi:MAG: hypothetical protein KIG61_08305 [Muribaculaceae bacterium]|nr:hypothetical protein [Muribaculaceae bacterium]
MASSRRKIRVILQRDSMQCGVACLCMIGRYWGIKCSLSGPNHLTCKINYLNCIEKLKSLDNRL